MSKFTAFLVNGDAFLLERENYSILVDGGDKNVLAKNYGATQLNPLPTYIVCTHRDSDHINGLTELLTAAKTHDSYKKNTELWLPCHLGKSSKLIEKYSTEANLLYKNRKNITDKLINRKTDEPSKKLAHVMLSELSFNDDSEIDNRHLSLVFHYHKEMNLKITRKNLRSFFALTKKEEDYAKRYNALLKAAYALDKKFPIRFFKHDTQNVSGGDQGRLVPINSTERKYCLLPTALDFFKLSSENKISLAFMSPEIHNQQNPSKSQQAVLFCADTDVSTCNFSLVQKHPKIVVFKNQPLITAPHHGSGSNEESYKFIQQNLLYLGKKFFVRGHCSRIGYIAHGFKCGHPRACTKPHTSCKNKHYPSSCQCKLTASQTVILETKNGLWKPDPNTKALP